METLSKRIIGISILSFFLFLTTFLSADPVVAQWSAGASYEVRDEDPANGFGLRLQRQILSGIPVIDLGLRGHFSYFSDEIEAETQSYTTEIDNYDFGMAAYGGVDLGLVNPYAGLGLGSESFESVRTGVNEQQFDEQSFYWNVFVGTEILPIPVIRPFIEYRFSRLFKDDEFDYSQNS
ncbi:MAG: outer membrane beta-barrel protein, partial [Balneolaceae bacterium]